MNTKRTRPALAAFALVLAAAGLSACETEGYTHALPIDGSTQAPSPSAGAAKQAAKQR